MGSFLDIRTPLITDDVALRGYFGGPAVSHVYWDFDGFHDSKGNSWTTNGTIPVSAKDATAGYPWRAGVFSDANYYSLGTGTSVLNFSGAPFLLVAVGISSAIPGATSCIFSNVNAGSTAGSAFYISNTGTVGFFNYGAAGIASTNTITPGVPFVMSAAQVGSTAYIKLNNGPVVSGAAGFTSNTANAVTLGKFFNGSQPSSTIQLFEFYASVQTVATYGVYAALAQINRTVLRGLGLDQPDYLAA